MLQKWLSQMDLFNIIVASRCVMRDRVHHVKFKRLYRVSVENIQKSFNVGKEKPPQQLKLKKRVPEKDGLVSIAAKMSAGGKFLIQVLYLITENSTVESIHARNIVTLQIVNRSVVLDHLKAFNFVHAAKHT